ncbi:hypothetical protein Pcinc_005621 [Petrolisthes cinctipes]|uniref:Uncharacterized protein n=1 Tax=Petrolisthes cinctipes TaxID=88211 RepID=A0AAE1KLN4_PETCI|nr:hypothetical protein Pcinc_018398 [Petrolisthes cinctipes]KAK3890436.1 hypothetical protein Pcinc_005621 [Petrolisthes cinctipes]
MKHRPILEFFLETSAHQPSWENTRNIDLTPVGPQALARYSTILYESRFSTCRRCGQAKENCLTAAIIFS